uniref:Protein PXR1 n=1 Tax=Rhizophora mucronata TaxID=61149 RepID=A0A2P2IRU1_RHIMU
MSSSLSFHLSLHANYFRSLSKTGMIKSLNPNIMKAFQAGPGVHITGTLSIKKGE